MNTGQLLLIYSISHLYFMYKLSFLLHSLLDNGAKMTPKRRSVFSLIFICFIFIFTVCAKFNLINLTTYFKTFGLMFYNRTSRSL